MVLETNTIWEWFINERNEIWIESKHVLNNLIMPILIKEFIENLFLN